MKRERTLIGKALAKKKCNWKTFFLTFSEFSLHFWLSYYHILHNDYRYVLCMSDIGFYWKNDWLVLWTFHKVEFYILNHTYKIVWKILHDNLVWRIWSNKTFFFLSTLCNDIFFTITTSAFSNQTHWKVRKWANALLSLNVEWFLLHSVRYISR